MLLCFAVDKRKVQYVGLSSGMDCSIVYRRGFARAINQKYKKWGDCKAAVFCEEKKKWVAAISGETAILQFSRAVRARFF